jgi:hypothetical protein
MAIPGATKASISTITILADSIFVFDFFSINFCYLSLARGML